MSQSGMKVYEPSSSWISPISSPARKITGSKKSPDSAVLLTEEIDAVSETTSPLQNVVQRFRPINACVTSNTKVKSLIKGNTLELPATVKSASAVKELLSHQSSIASGDIMLVSQAQEFSGEMEVSDTKMVYAMIRTKATSLITFNLCVNNGSSKTNLEFTVSASTKVYQLKRELRKVTKISEFGMRCIIGGRMLKDENMIGDYILSTSLSSSKVQRKQSQQKRVTMYVSKTIDMKKDVNIKFYLLGGNVVKSYFELQSPISGLHALLRSITRIPMNISWNLCVEMLDSLVLLDTDKCLFDYGVNENKREQSVNIFVLPCDIPVPTIRDFSSNFTMKLSPKALFNKLHKLDTDRGSIGDKLDLNETKKRLDLVGGRADTLAKAIASRVNDSSTSTSCVVNSDDNNNDNNNNGEMDIKAKKRKNNVGGLFSKMKKGFLATTSKKTSAKKGKDAWTSSVNVTAVSTLDAETKPIAVNAQVRDDAMNPYDDPDSVLNQMD